MPVNLHGEACCRRGVDDEADALGGVALSHSFVGGPEQVGNGVVVQIEVEAAFFGCGDLVDVVGQPSESLGLLGQGGAGVGSEGGDAVVQALVVGAQGGDRGPQLVREVGEHPPAGVLDPFEPGRHGVERGCEGLQLGAGTDQWDPRGVVASAELSGGVGYLVQGASQTPGEEPSHCGGGQQGDEQPHADRDE